MYESGGNCGQPNPTMREREPRTYTYRIPVDDSRALRKVNALESLHDDYRIHELNKSDVPTHGTGRHFGFVFYQSKERYDYDRREMVGGTIPELGEYRYSLEWEECPADSQLEMKNANGGGTRIRGTQFVGTHDTRLPDRVPIDMVVPWTPTEIAAMFDGKPVRDRANYSHDPPEIPANEAREQFREKLRWAEQDGFEKLQERLREYVENCDHDHVLETSREHGDVAFCEDCGRGWDSYEYENVEETVTVVGTA